MASSVDNLIEMQNSNSEDKQTHRQVHTTVGSTTQQNFDIPGYDIRCKNRISSTFPFKTCFHPIAI